MNRTRFCRFIYPFSLLVLLGLAGCGQAPVPASALTSAHPVDIITATPERFTVTAQLPGRVEPVREAQVRARVAGIVVQRLFEEGQDVNSGDVLFQIDPAPLQAALSRAQAQFAGADALLAQARATAERAAALIEVQAISKQEFEAATASLHTTRANRAAAHANLETARLNLAHAAVQAPISGRIGRAYVTEGALVGHAEATLLTTIQQLDPIYVNFTQPATEVQRMLQRAGDSSGDSKAPATVSLELDGVVYPHRGAVLFTGSSVDPSTGQVVLRSRFANPQGALLPGMYLRVSMPQGVESDTLFVPQRAVKRDWAGQAWVMLAGTGNKAERRAVQTGVMDGSRWQITQGLDAGDRVIISPTAMLKPGDLLAPTQ